MTPPPPGARSNGLNQPPLQPPPPRPQLQPEGLQLEAPPRFPQHDDLSIGAAAERERSETQQQYKRPPPRPKRAVASHLGYGIQDELDLASRTELPSTPLASPRQAMRPTPMMPPSFVARPTGIQHSGVATDRATVDPCVPQPSDGQGMLNSQRRTSSATHRILRRHLSGTNHAQPSQTWRPARAESPSESIDGSGDGTSPDGNTDSWRSVNAACDTEATGAILAAWLCQWKMEPEKLKRRKDMLRRLASPRCLSDYQLSQQTFDGKGLRLRTIDVEEAISYVEGPTASSPLRRRTGSSSGSSWWQREDESRWSRRWWSAGGDSNWSWNEHDARD